MPPRVRDREYDRQYAARNREARAAYLREHRARYPEKHREYARTSQRKQRALKHGVTTSDEKATRQYIEIVSKDPCSYCGEVASEADHIVPFSVGGADDWDNLTGSCRSCNSRKQERSLLQWLMVSDGYSNV